MKGYIPQAVLRRGIEVSSAAIAMAPAVAECSLILGFLGLRQIHRDDAAMHSNDPDRAWLGRDAFGMGEEIASQRIGVIGAGGVGRIVIGHLRALNAEIWVSDPYLSDEAASQLGARKATLEDLMRSCPIVVNHAPTTPETHHLIGAPELALLPESVYLVNTARSRVIDQDALLAELASGRIRAALDVFDREPLPLDHPFRSLPNVILTPHIAGGTRETRDRQGACVVRNLTRAPPSPTTSPWSDTPSSPDPLPHPGGFTAPGRSSHLAGVRPRIVPRRPGVATARRSSRPPHGRLSGTSPNPGDTPHAPSTSANRTATPPAAREAAIA